jgi:ABC-type multidrug transport system ATPase subunit
MIAHRLSTVRECDKIIVLKNGVISEEGSHDVLLQKGGIYKMLWEKQNEQEEREIKEKEEKLKEEMERKETMEKRKMERATKVKMAIN